MGESAPDWRVLRYREIYATHIEQRLVGVFYLCQAGVEVTVAASETLQGHRRHVIEPRDRPGESNPVARAGGFQMVQEDDHWSGRRDGPENI